MASADASVMRLWRGTTAAADADLYFRHVTTKVLPTLRRLTGHLGSMVLRRDAGGQVEFLVITRWRSLDSIRAFAGSDPKVAVVDPEARAVLTSFDSVVEHYELAFELTASSS